MTTQDLLITVSLFSSLLISCVYQFNVSLFFKLNPIYANLILISITKCNIYILDKMYQLLVSIAKLVDSKIMKVKTAVKFVRLVGGNL